MLSSLRFARERQRNLSVRLLASLCALPFPAATVTTISKWRATSRPTTCSTAQRTLRRALRECGGTFPQRWARLPPAAAATAVIGQARRLALQRRLQRLVERGHAPILLRVRLAAPHLRTIRARKPEERARRRAQFLQPAPADQRQRLRRRRPARPAPKRRQRSNGDVSVSLLKDTMDPIHVSSSLIFP